MDPDANLREQIELSQRLLFAMDVRVADDHDRAHVAARLAELILELDEWIAKGNARPRRWDRP